MGGIGTTLTSGLFTGRRGRGVLILIQTRSPNNNTPMSFRGLIVIP